MDAAAKLRRGSLSQHFSSQTLADQHSTLHKHNVSAFLPQNQLSQPLSQGGLGNCTKRRNLGQCNKAGGWKVLLRDFKTDKCHLSGSHTFFNTCSGFPQGRKASERTGRPFSQRAKVTACAQGPSQNAHLKEGDIAASNGPQPKELPSAEVSPAGDQNQSGAANVSQEEKNVRGNINWRRRALQAAKGDEIPFTAPPPDFVSDRPQRPFRIFLVRHGESEGNMDESMYTRIPDSKISLTDRGKRQAEDAGQRIRKIIQAGQEGGDDNWMVYFYVSPYLRTLQTLRGIGAAFERRRIAGVREEPRLREQDFGNFQDREKMRVEKTIRLRFGRFFYRFPDGESAADVYDRVTGFRETLRTDIDVGRFQKEASRRTNMNLVLVSHGLTLRVFLMRWYKWTVDQFQLLHNFGNADFLVMELGPGGRYSLTAHHSHEELRDFGFSPDMIADQEWQVTARPGDLNCEWPTSGPSFFDYFENLEEGDGLKYPDRSPTFDKVIRDLECPPTQEELTEIGQFPT